tara:strand:- start:1869 stop:2189 length:321 start_codon:yes stop_codon:yes gene_type:complete
MTKKGPLGKAEVFYVKEHYKDLDEKEIAKELDRPIATIRKQVEKFVKENPKEARLGSAGSQMARRDGIVTMTGNASAAADDSRARRTSSRVSRCVTTIKGDGKGDG